MKKGLGTYLIIFCGFAFLSLNVSAETALIKNQQQYTSTVSLANFSADFSFPLIGEGNTNTFQVLSHLQSHDYDLLNEVSLLNVSGFCTRSIRPNRCYLLRAALHHIYPTHHFW